jgi:hypothetical protein
MTRRTSGILMDYQQYIGRLKELAGAIQKDARFRPLVEIERPFSAGEFADLEGSMERAGMDDVAVWQEFRNFHGVANGFLFQWLYQGREPVAIKSGSAQIAMVQEIYLPEHLPPSKAGLFYGERRVIDRMSPDDQVAVRFRKGVHEPELHYFSDVTGDYHRLTLDFPGYLEMLLEARAMYRWQQFFVADPTFPLSEEDAETFRGALESLFPDANVGLFRARPAP